MSTGHDRRGRVFVESLVTRSGIPASHAEVDALADAMTSIDAAIQRLYAVPVDHETEPATELTHPDA